MFSLQQFCAVVSGQVPRHKPVSGERSASNLCYLPHLFSSHFFTSIFSFLISPTLQRYFLKRKLLRLYSGYIPSIITKQQNISLGNPGVLHPLTHSPVCCFITERSLGSTELTRGEFVQSQANTAAV